MTPFPEDLRGVLFDLDGTLVDTAEEFVVVVQRLREEHGRGPMDEDAIRCQVSNGARALTTLALDLPEEHPDFEPQRLRLLAIYSEELGKVAAPYPGVPELLDEFDSRGIGWGIATNKPWAYAEPLLQRIGLLPRAGSVICPDHVANRKPDPECLQLGCRDLDCRVDQAIYVGDHQRDIDAGRNAGMYSVAAAYGYIVDGDDPATWGADALVERSEDLHSLIFNR